MCLNSLAPAHAAASSGSASHSGDAWVLHVSDSGLEVSLRSLLYPGFEYILEAGTSNGFGGSYFGLGDRNDDLLFMI